MDEGFSYLDEMNTFQNLKCSCSKPSDFLNVDTINEALKVNLLYKLKKLVNNYTTSKATKKDFVNSMYALDVVEVSE